MNVIRSFDFLGIPGVHEPESEFEPKFGFDHQIFSNVKVENTSQTPTLKKNQKEIDSIRSINESENSSISKSIESNESEFLIRITQSKKLNQKIKKSKTYQNSEKKRKADQLNEVLLFTFSQNRQNAIVAMHRAKSTMKKTYALIQNFNMIKIINQIDQIINEKIEIRKINPNFELFNIQKKLNRILTKIEIVSTKFSTTQNSKSSTSNPFFTNNKNRQKSTQMSKSTTVKSANTITTTKNPINVVTSTEIPIVAAATTTTNTANVTWTQIVSKNVIKKIQKIQKNESIKITQNVEINK